jgi:hypothetical protein
MQRFFELISDLFGFFGKEEATLGAYLLLSCVSSGYLASPKKVLELADKVFKRWRDQRERKLQTLSIIKK